MDCRGFYKRHEARLGRPFEAYGALIVRYPWRILICCISVNCLLGIGLVRLESETDVEVLYFPENSQASKDREKIRNIFPDTSGSNFYSRGTADESMRADVIVKTKDNSNILTTSYVDEIQNIYNYVSNSVEVTSGGSTKGLSDVCALRSGTCVVDGDVVFSTAFRTAMSSNSISFPVFNNEYIRGIFGSAVSSGGVLTSATMVRLTFFLRTDTSSAEDLSDKWEDAFLLAMPQYSSSLVDVAYSASKSLSDELDKNVAGDISFFALTITLMLCYAGLATGGGDCVSNRQNLGFAGVLATVLAILGSFGFVSAIGVKFVSLVGIMPFLVIGIGLDDMFILLSCLADATAKTTIEDKIKETLRTGGIAITITSVTDFLAFMIGASAPFISVRNFCIYTGIAILFCYINQLTFFLPCIVINEQRMANSKHCGTCKTIKSREELRKDGKSKSHVFCCGGQIPKSRVDNESPVETYPKLIFRKILQFRASVVIIFLLFAGYLAAAINGVVNFKEGLLLSNLVTEDSYVYTYQKLDENYFPSEFPIGFTIQTTITYSDTSTQNSISDLLSAAKADRDINPSTSFDWLTDYKNSGSYSATSEANFIAGLKTFLSSRTDHANDVIFNAAETSIIASRFFVVTNTIPESKDQGQVMLRMREVAENSPLSLICFSWFFLPFEQFVAVLPTTLLTVGVAIIAMFVVTILFMPHPLLVICVTGTMVMICTGVFGFMHYWDLTLSSITMIDIVMSIGFSVDFSAHICHAYISVDGSTRKERVNNALDRAGGPIINAALSSIIGVLLLVFSSSYIFRSFFKMMMLVITFGLAHAMLLLPAIFLIIGPVTVEKSSNNTKMQTSAVSVDKLRNNQVQDDQENGNIENFKSANQSDSNGTMNLAYTA